MHFYIPRATESPLSRHSASVASAGLVKAFCLCLMQIHAYEGKGAHHVQSAHVGHVSAGVMERQRRCLAVLARESVRSVPPLLTVAAWTAKASHCDYGHHSPLAPPAAAETVSHTIHWYACVFYPLSPGCTGYCVWAVWWGSLHV